MELFLTILFVFLGALLLVVEVTLIPEFGLTGALGIASFVAAVVYAFMMMGSVAGWATLLSVLALVTLLVLWAVYGKPFKKLALKANIDSTLKVTEAASVAVGDEGVAVTRLALVGEVDFGKVRLDVVSDDGFIDQGTAVCVSRITESAVFVRKAAGK